MQEGLGYTRAMISMRHSYFSASTALTGGERRRRRRGGGGGRGGGESGRRRKRRKGRGGREEEETYWNLLYICLLARQMHFSHGISIRVI